MCLNVKIFYSNNRILSLEYTLRVFALANKQDELEFELSSMASLLAKFRIDYSDLQLISDITKKPQDTTVHYFNELIKDFHRPDGNESGGK